MYFRDAVFVKKTTATVTTDRKTIKQEQTQKKVDEYISIDLK